MYRHLLTLLIFGTTHLALVGPASGYVRTRTCDPAGLDGPYCAAEQLPTPVRWRDTCITIFANNLGTDDLPRQVDQIKPALNDTLRRAILGSAEAWNRHDCSAMQIIYGGVTCSDEISRIPTQLRARQINLIVFQEEFWDYPSDAIAITTVTADPRSGEIYDADVEFNGVDYTFEEVEDPSSSSMDIRNVLTHELGHLIGFAHESAQEDSTMFPDAQPGETLKRDLNTGDVEGLCSVYPLTESTPLTCAPTYPQQDETCAVVMEGKTALWCVVAGALWRRRRARLI